MSQSCSHTTTETSTSSRETTYCRLNVPTSVRTAAGTYGPMMATAINLDNSFVLQIGSTLLNLASPWYTTSGRPNPGVETSANCHGDSNQRVIHPCNARPTNVLPVSCRWRVIDEMPSSALYPARTLENITGRRLLTSPPSSAPTSS